MEMTTASFLANLGLLTGVVSSAGVTTHLEEW